jgi:hypothetical protein
MSKMPSILSTTPAAARRAQPDEHASYSPSGTSQELSARMLGSSPKAAEKSGSDVSRLMSLLMHTLFALVALLLVADLHSSYLAGSSKWEINPFMTVLAEHFGRQSALLAIKAADFLCLFGMYALWRRSRAHVVIALALSSSAFVYVEIVLNNYSS